MVNRASKWRLRDLVDFEVLLRSGESGKRPPGADPCRAAVREALEKRRPRREGARRRLGLRVWLEARREGETAGWGRHVTGAVRLAGGLLGVIAFLFGIGLMRGLLVEVEDLGRCYHVWVFLAVSLGLQWLFLGLSTGGYLLVRRRTGALSVAEHLVAWLAGRFATVVDGEVWRRLLRGGEGYRPVVSWRVARMVQGAGVLYNLGLLAGFFGCLWFLKIGFFWESSLPAFSWPKLVQLMQVLALPWSWSGTALPPAWEEQDFSLLRQRFFDEEGGADWWPFMMMAIAVWGLLPRLLLWLGCLWREQRALAGLSFQEPRHRELWRELTRIDRGEPASGPADGVVLLDVGGIDVPTEALRGFLLRHLRVNPEARYTASILDEGREAEAWEAIERAPLGVVFLVEGWALSPKQMNALHKRFRSGDPERPLRFLVLGPIRGGLPSAPAAGDVTQWKAYVDGLRDPAVEVIAYHETEARS